MRWPNGSATKPTVSSSYGPRTKPCPTCSAWHRGTDFVGFDQVRAIAAGRVARVGVIPGWAGGGSQVWIQHDGYFSRSLHLGSVAVSVGQNINEGDYLGAMDTTGTATGKHLHLEIQNGAVSTSNIAEFNPVEFIGNRLSSPAGQAAGGLTGDVMQLQTDLNFLNFGQLTVDGNYGPATKAAVEAAQRFAGLAVDGIAGPVTYGWVALAVKSIQDGLRQIGYEISNDGKAGPATVGALKTFQAKESLTADGVYGPQTKQRLLARMAQPVGGNQVAGRAIVDIQKLVGANPDGIWGPETTAKVITWQGLNGLVSDGIWGPASDAKGFPVVPVAPKITVDGVWGEGTTSSIQVHLNVLPVDGIRGPATTVAIQTAIGMPESKRDGLWGAETATWLQTFLIEQGYSLDPWGADGDFGTTSISRLQEFLNSEKPFTAVVKAPTVPTPTPTNPTQPIEPTGKDNPRGLMPYTPVYPGAKFGLVAPLGDGTRDYRGTTKVTPLIDTFAWHRTANNGDELDWFSYKNSRSSCPNWYIRFDGTVIELIRPKMKPALTGPDWNYRTLGVELQGAGDGTAQQRAAMVKLVAWCAKQGRTIDGVSSAYDLTRARNLGHREMLPGSTACPGDWWIAQIEPSLVEARALNAAPTPQPEPTPTPIPTPEPEPTPTPPPDTVAVLRSDLQTWSAKIEGYLAD